MYAGGWKNFETFRRCYQYPDSDTMQAVADLAPIPDRRTQKRTHFLELVENEKRRRSGKAKQRRELVPVAPPGLEPGLS